MHRANSVRYVDHSQQQQRPDQMEGFGGRQEAAELAAELQGRTGASRGGSVGQASCGRAEPAAGAHQQGQEQAQGQLKSYFSDGDFTEVLIKINDHDDQAQASRQHLPSGAAGEAEHQQQRARQQVAQQPAPADVRRRRSSCSDATSDSKRSSLTSHDCEAPAR